MASAQDFVGRKPITAIVLAASCLPMLAGCMGPAKEATHSLGGGTGEKTLKLTVPETVKAAQESAIAKAQGGEVGTLISWAEPKSGLEGSLTWDKAVMMTYSCRRYKQTMSVGNELLTGTLTACPQGDNTWKIESTHPDAERTPLSR